MHPSGGGAPGPLAGGRYTAAWPLRKRRPIKAACGAAPAPRRYSRQPVWMATIPPERLRQPTRSRPAARIIAARLS